VKDGGLGVRRVASLALPAFIASAASTCHQQDLILSVGVFRKERVLDDYEVS